LDVSHHAKWNPRVVDLLQPDYHPEEMGKYSPQLSVPYPILLAFAYLILLPQLAVVNLHHSLLHCLIHFLLFFDIKSFSIIGGPLIEEISQIEANVIKLTELKVKQVKVCLSEEDVAQVAVIMR